MMELFPQYHHTAGVFSLPELLKQQTSRTQTHLSIKRNLLNAVVPNKKEFLKLTEGIWSMITTFWERE